MSAIGILCVAIATIVVALLWAVAIFRADTRRTRETERTAFQHGATVRGPTVERMQRDRRLAFHGRVRQQIRVIPPDAH